MKASPELVNIAPTPYLMLDGEGSPETFSAMATLLRSVAVRMGVTFGPLEARWWTSDGSDMTEANPEAWRWTIMLPLTSPAADSVFTAAVDDERLHYNDPHLDALRTEDYGDGQAVQVAFTGSLQHKQPALAEMNKFIQKHHLQATGNYHEVYLDDPGPGAPANARTILRQPVVDAPQ